MILKDILLCAGFSLALPIGQTLFKTGDMWVAFVGSDAAYSDDLNFFLTIGDFSTNQVLFNNHTAAGGDEVDVNDGAINVGDEAIFGICTEESGGNGPVDCAAELRIGGLPMLAW